ncbi:MAG: C10 family peptidase [Prevotella sp.]|nr:C10 family peptidase [Prevotella sp.]
MNKSITTAILLFMATFVMANPVDKQRARQQAQAFFAERGVSIVGEPRRAPGQSATVENQPLYVFNAASNKGFVIIAGDDRAEQILGYVETGSYDEQNLPPNFCSWLKMVADEIKSLPRVDSSFDTSYRAPLFVPTHTAISPLIKTEWNQGSSEVEGGYIYNEQTPTIDGKHCLTGCVATAGAQIMYYYKYPKTATAEMPSYTKSDITYESLPATTFKWSKMKTKYTSEDQNTEASGAVSTLMKYCGWAAKMDYGLDGSGANESVLANGMQNYFNYDPNWKSVYRDNYTVSDWDAIIYAELAAGRPVLYSGQAWVNSGHAFICDGYDGEGLYHFNWGWGGSYNGYFKLHATNPTPTAQFTNGQFDSGYIITASAIIGLQPNTGVAVNDDQNDSWEAPVADGTVATVFDAEIQGTSIVLGMGNGNEDALGFGYGMGELGTNGTITMIDKKYEYMQSYVLNCRSYYPDRTFDTSTYGLANGKHHLVPMSLLKGESTWKRCKPLEMYFEVTVSNGSVTNIVQHPVEDLEITDLICTSSMQPNTNQVLSFKVKNNGDNFDGSLFLFASKTTDMGSCSSSCSLKIKAGNMKERTMIFKAGDAGVYNIWITSDYQGENIIGQTTVTIAQKLQLLEVTFPGNKLATKKQPVVATVKSIAGDYTQPLYLFASSSSSNMGSAIYCAASGIEKGKTEDITFYFKPAAAGSYKVWICTDKAGQNVVGTGTVTIIDPPTGEVTLAASNRTFNVGPTTTMTMTVKNTGTVTYYETIWTFIYQKEGNSWVSKTYDETNELTIKSGETVTVTHVFEDLLPGEYMVSSNYSPTFGSNSAKSLGRETFTVTDGTPTAISSTKSEESVSTGWYSLEGVKLADKPVKKGVYVKDGKKFVVK